MATADIEMEELRDKDPRNAEKPIYNSQDARENTVSVWVWLSSAILSLASVLLLIFPRLLLFTAESSTEARTLLTPLETFICTHFGILIASLVVTLILNIPSFAPITPREEMTNIQTHPLLGPLTGGCILSAFLAWNTSTVGPLAILVFLGSGSIGLFGLWAIAFAGSARISRKTGADKHTSTFIFGNKSAASKQKKQWKKEQKSR
ncbi:hypothetical protein OE88DRAFT_1653267 [Heliocybe sulcata]|uniref:Uncharacterized protein n=1 Tax=Heliocybe sulcata TaxID=5364 RepID=A0A5C3NFG9_9AGAM|nr:hypothetical protein OE88DRAFT_1653267 [Heliocybe sulcata]